jgi:hypothetical protein
MARRAVDLSMVELATMGAKAAQRAVQKAHDAGLMITGTVDRLEDERAVPSVAWRHPPEIVARRDTRTGKLGGSKKSEASKTAVRQSSTD